MEKSLCSAGKLSGKKSELPAQYSRSSLCSVNGKKCGFLRHLAGHRDHHVVLHDECLRVRRLHYVPTKLKKCSDAGCSPATPGLLTFEMRQRVCWQDLPPVYGGGLFYVVSVYSLGASLQLFQPCAAITVAPPPPAPCSQPAFLVLPGHMCSVCLGKRLVRRPCSAYLFLFPPVEGYPKAAVPRVLPSALLPLRRF